MTDVLHVLPHPVHMKIAPSSRTRTLVLAVGVAALSLVTTEPKAAERSATAASLPTVARFHLALSKSEPAANDTVAGNPHAVQLWFTESVQLKATGVQVTASDKRVVALGELTVASTTNAPVVAEFKEVLKPGKYMVSWKTMAADGHPTKGEFAFVVGAKAAR